MSREVTENPVYYKYKGIWPLAAIIVMTFMAKTVINHATVVLLLMFLLL